MRTKISCVLALGACVTLSPCLIAQTDGGGFVTNVLMAGGYHAIVTHNDGAPGAGCDPGATLRSSDYLCDGETNESNIIPELGLALGEPVGEAEDCDGNDPAALAWNVDVDLSGFDENTILEGDGTHLISELLATGDLIDFDAATGAADDAMAYAWFYVNNLTGTAIPVDVAIASDDSITVEINRVEVMSIGACRGFGGAGAIQDRRPASLAPGGNLVQVKIWDGCCGFGFRLRFEDPAGCRSLVHQPGVLEFGIEPIDVFVPPGCRTIETAGTPPAEVTANVTVNVDNGGASYTLEESWAAGWTASGMSPAATSSGAEFARWENISAASVSYTLTRSGSWGANEGHVSGSITMDDAESAVACQNTIPGGLPTFVPEFLMTASLAIQADEGPDAGLHGCNMTGDEIAKLWIYDSDQGIDDINIIPEEGLVILNDWWDPEGDVDEQSNSGGLSLLGPNAEANFWIDDNLGPFRLVRVASSDGFVDVQRADIFESDVQDSMCIGYFYANNPDAEARTVLVGFGSDDAGAVRVNGRIAHSVAACRGHPGFADKFVIQLDPGKNLIACYAFENASGYNFCIRFEDELFNPIAIQTTVDPDGYDPSPAAHPDPGDLPSFAVPEVLVTTSYQMETYEGCNVPTSAIRGDWLTDADGEVTDANIVPEDGMEISPDFLGNAPYISGPDPQLDFATPAALVSTALKPMLGGNGFFNFDGPGGFGAVDQSMCVAFFYVINPDEDGRCVQIGFGSDDSAGVRVNGRPVFAISACRGHPAFTDKFLAWLDPGKNLFSVYTFENGSGYNMCIRFEDPDTGGLLAVETTLDPSGYDPADHGDPPEACAPAGAGDAEVYVRSGASVGFVTQFLVPALVMDQGLGANTNGGALPEDYVSQDGGPVDPELLHEGAKVEAGSSGLITTGVRGAEDCGFTTLVKFDGFVDGNPADPGLFNGEAFYGNPDQYSSSLFFHIENKTDDDLEAWFGFASDDGASLFVNGELIAEHLAGRGFGGANELQTLAQQPALLEPGENWVQISYNEGGGGSGARVAFHSSSCRDAAFTVQQVGVTANPPGFEPPTGATRDIVGLSCDGDSDIVLTFGVPGGGSDNVSVREVIPDGTTGSNPSMGSFNGVLLSFDGEVSDGDTLTYTVSDAQIGQGFCDGEVNDLAIAGEATFRRGTDVCDFDDGIYLNCGGPQVEDSTGRVWLGDEAGNPSQYLVSGDIHVALFALGFGGAPDFVSDEYIADLELDSSQPVDQNILLGERWDDGDLNYRFTGLPDGDYEVALLFLEGCCSDGCLSDGSEPCDAVSPVDGSPPLVDPADPAVSAGGCRVFDILVNGTIVRDQFSQNAAAACLVGGAPGALSNLIAVSVVTTIAVEDGTIDIVIDDLGGGNPPENSAIKGIVIRSSSGPRENCTNGSDDDGDGLADCDDPDCAETAACVETICDDGEDNDDDGLADCLDSDCRDLGEDVCPGGGFVRGDSNSSGIVDLTDGVVTLNFLFTGGSAPLCQNAADTDNNGQLVISDAVITFSYLFTGGPAPQAPSPSATNYAPEDCGPDTGGDLGCETPATKCL